MYPEYEKKELENEIWEILEGFEGIIKVSNLGRFEKKGKIIQVSRYSNNYQQFSTQFNKTRHTAIAHRLIAKTFISNPENKKYVNHKNGIRWDNRVSNLEWCTQSENIKHAFNILKRKGRDSLGSKNSKAVLNEEKVLEIRDLYKKGLKTQVQLSIIFKVTRAVIWKIITKYNWKHI